MYVDSQHKSNSIQRSRLLRYNVFASFLLKGWSATIVFIMVPLTLKILGKYDNGVWLTISSLLVWVDLMDIGLGNGLRNAVARYHAEDNPIKIREAISSTLFMLAVIVVVVAILLSLLVILCDSHDLLGVDSNRLPNLTATLIVAIVMISMTFLLKITGNVFMGMQLPAVNNLLITLGQSIALIGTAIAYFLDCHSLFIVVAINVAAPMLIWLCSFPYTFCIKYPEFRPSLNDIHLKTAKNLCLIGMKFFILQICSVLLFASASLIISNVISPEQVTCYQVAYRYFSIMLVLFTIVCMPYWNATTDAYSHGDIQWIKQASTKLNIMLACIAMGFAVMITISDVVYRFWVGSEIVVPLSLSISMACYLFTIIASMRYSYFLNGIGELRVQLLFTIPVAIIFLPLAWWACTIFGSVTSLVVVMCIVNVPGLIANIWKFNVIISKKYNAK